VPDSWRGVPVGQDRHGGHHRVVTGIRLGDALIYGGQYVAMAPLFEHYGIQLWALKQAAPSTFRPKGTSS